MSELSAVPTSGGASLLSTLEVSSAMLRRTHDLQAAFVTSPCENCSEFLRTLTILDEDQGPTYLNVLHSTFLAAIILVATIGNGLVSIVLVRKRHLSPSSRLVLSLCSSNLVLSCGVLPFSFIASIVGRWTFGLYWCWTSAFLIQFVISASNMTLAAIAVDRYFAIVKPMSYSMTITSAKSVFILLAIWFLALVTSLPPFFGWLRFTYQPMYSMCLVVWEDSALYTSTLFLLNIVLPLLIMAISYGRIFQIARSKYKKINIGTISAVIRIDTRQSISQNQLEMAKQLPRRYVRKPSWLSIVLQSPVKGFAVICCILGVFCLCWTPYVISLILAFCRISPMTLWQKRIAFEIALLSVPSYPVIYGLLNRSIRKDLFAWMRSKNQWKSQHRNSAVVGLLDYTPPFSQWQFNCQAASTPLQRVKDPHDSATRCHRKPSDDSGHYSLPAEDLETMSASGSQLSGVAESCLNQSEDSVRTKDSSCSQLLILAEENSHSSSTEQFPPQTASVIYVDSSLT